MSFLRNIAEKIVDAKNPTHQSIRRLSRKELEKRPTRTDVINFVLGTIGGNLNYLEIGVRNPQDNFNHINASNKYSVDPGVEYEENPVDFKMTSDEFFNALRTGKVLNSQKFDAIFIDGLHLAEQVERDINNSLEFIKDDGFIFMHDCNPPSEWHARETYTYKMSPAGGNWNGTTWKAFVQARKRIDIYSCCIDTDWGVGVISKTKPLGKSNTVENRFYEYAVMEAKRRESLNLMSFDEFKKLF
ncbi:class I SAM-dependent methyltransferase [Ekhidna sp.]|uniref:class I SAM-dependent methyltransferase n=1 Tax=Ekhidna sp. TaxID=2608089 RepID=UPI0035186C07